MKNDMADGITAHQVTFPDNRRVTALGQGTWKMGRVLSARAEEIRALRVGIELGMSAIDTAEMYNNEELVGEAIRGYRDRVFLIGKVLPQHAGACDAVRACEASLRKLGTDHFDLYLLHWRGPVPLEETVGAMMELQRMGKIDQWGVSNFDIDDLEELDAIPCGNTCAADEVAYNLMNRGIEYDLVPWCKGNGMPVIAYSPVGEGSLAENSALLGVARRHRATPAQIALAWVLRLPGMMAIPKAGTVAHVRENFRSLSIELTPEDLKDLAAVFPPPRQKTPLAMW